ncbi:MAG: hypothetical protein A2W99_15330 [Bacteroidetes bacterium GWF2_33_16]|nr:MAG: hypothetical protein A2X00_09540 [Bacteroidetes bacterium GWE2_32_14]OFY07692.1 MAG: hypothetical protein A2W99_15330 [Bacteroidetes bacterium GWF2_33_16]
MVVLLSLQLFLDNLIKTLLSLIKIILLSKWNITIKMKRQSRDCIILGNGPSLNNVLEKEIDILLGKDLLCVNYFVLSKFYKILKPTYYVINAPELWNKNAIEKIKEDSEKLFRSIGEETNWELTLFIPFSANTNKKWLSDLGSNKNICISYYNPTPIDGFECTNSFFFKYGFGMPRPHNVIIPSLIFTIRMRYQNIYLLGVDHSWLKEITVDNDNNVLINQKHFYDTQTSVPQTMHKKGIGQRRLHEVLQKFVYSFKGYFDIKNFALRQKVTIYNCTPDSYIDAFEKKRLDQIN